MENSLKIIVKPVPRQSVQNRHMQPVVVYDPIKKQRVDLGQASGKTKATGAVDVYYFDQDMQRGVYNTGLEELVLNPYKDMDWLEVKMQCGLNDKWDSILPSLVKQDKLSKQIYYEILDAVEPNFYTSRISQSIMRPGTAYDPKIQKSFIEGFNITLYDGSNVFTSDTSRGRFAIQLIKSKRNIAKSRDVYNVNYHTFYIAEENEEELDRVRNDDVENTAIAALINIQTKYPQFKLYQLAVVIRNETGGSIINTVGEVAPQIVRDQLNRFIKNKGNNKSQRIELFMNGVKLFNDDPERFMIEYMYSQGINTRIITVRDGYVYWNSKMEVPNLHKWKSDTALKNFIYEAYTQYNPKQPDETNAYAEMKLELITKGIKFE